MRTVIIAFLCVLLLLGAIASKTLPTTNTGLPSSGAPADQTQTIAEQDDAAEVSGPSAPQSERLE